MVSKMAMEDVRRLKSSGVEIDPEDIVRLNQLGLECERDWDESFNNLPRVAVVNGITLREPTIGAEIWFKRCEDYFNLEDFDTWFVLRVYALSMDQSELPDFKDPSMIRESAMKILSGELGGSTTRMVAEALKYVTFGMERNDVEFEDEKSSQSDSEEGVDDRSCPAYGVLKYGLVMELGSMEELKCFTTSQLDFLTTMKRRQNGEDVMKHSHGRAVGRYFVFLNRIRHRHEEKRKTDSEVKNG